MKDKTISEIDEKYDLELEKIIMTIKKEKAKKVLLQFPEGMKPYSIVISKEIEKRTGCNSFIWLGSCFGACDVPFQVENLGIDLIIQFGHSIWNHSKDAQLKILE